MVSANDLSMLARYAAWANRLLYASLAMLPATELTAPRPIFTGNILRMLHHVYLMDKVWQSHLLGVSHGLTTRNPESSPPFNALRNLQREMDAWYVDYADALTPTARDQLVHFTFIGGGEGSMRRADILLHVVNHVTYHRGHIAGMMYQIPAEPPTTDLPVFLRETAPVVLDCTGSRATMHGPA